MNPEESSLSIAISKFTEKKARLAYGNLHNVKVCWLSTIYDKINFKKKILKILIFYFFQD